MIKRIAQMLLLLLMSLAVVFAIYTYQHMPALLLTFFVGQIHALAVGACSYTIYRSK